MAELKKPQLGRLYKMSAVIRVYVYRIKDLVEKNIARTWNAVFTSFSLFQVLAILLSHIF